VTIGEGVSRPLKLLILDIISTAEEKYPDLNKRATFIKFELEQKEGYYWNVFVF